MSIIEIPLKAVDIRTQQISLRQRISRIQTDALRKSVENIDGVLQKNEIQTIQQKQMYATLQFQKSNNFTRNSSIDSVEKKQSFQHKMSHTKSSNTQDLKLMELLSEK